MRKNKFKIIILIVFILVLIVGSMYFIDLDRIKKGEKVVFSTWGRKDEPVIKINPNENNKKLDYSYQKYSKVIDHMKLEFNLPNDWNYQEMQEEKANDSYKYALKLYKNSEEQYATLYISNNPFGVCGTGRITEDLILENGEKATIGYYSGNKNWSDISFHYVNQYVAVINHNLIDEEATEAMDFIKNINIIEKD